MHKRSKRAKSGGRNRPKFSIQFVVPLVQREELAHGAAATAGPRGAASLCRVALALLRKGEMVRFVQRMHVARLQVQLGCSLVQIESPALISREHGLLFPVFE